MRFYLAVQPQNRCPSLPVEVDMEEMSQILYNGSDYGSGRTSCTIYCNTPYHIK